METTAPAKVSTLVLVPCLRVLLGLNGLRGQRVQSVVVAASQRGRDCAKMVLIVRAKVPRRWLAMR